MSFPLAFNIFVDLKRFHLGPLLASYLGFDTINSVAIFLPYHLKNINNIFSLWNYNNLPLI